MLIGINHIPSFIKSAIETVAKHNLLHSLTDYVSDFEVQNKNNIDTNTFPIAQPSSESRTISQEMVEQHSRLHEYLLEYPEYADEFWQGGKLDETLDATMKAAFMIVKAKARRIENEKRDTEEMVNKSGDLLKRLIAIHVGKEQEGDEED